MTELPGYTPYWASAQRKGYSGVGVYAKVDPLEVRIMGISDFDDEGRVLALEYPDFTLFNCYFPNSQAEGKRLAYKLEFCQALKEESDTLIASGRHVIICGDYNIAHTPIDLANPKSNEKNPGYLPEERAWMDTFLESGYIDTFRKFNPDPHNYTWWSYRMNARERNVGWRIDYFCTDGGMEKKIKDAGIQSQVMGSDHCPVSLEIDV